MKIGSYKLTAIVMNMRDELKENAIKLRSEAEQDFKLSQEKADSLIYEAKRKRHAAIIAANKMEREAQIIQDALNEELELMAKQDKDAAKAWECKSIERMSVENENFIELMVGAKGGK